MKRTAVSICALSLSIVTHAQIGIDVNKNYKIVYHYKTAKVGDAMTEQHIGMDVNSKGDIIVATMHEKDGKVQPRLTYFHYDKQYNTHDRVYMDYYYTGLNYTNTINEVKVLNDDWVVIAGKGFVAFLDEELSVKVILQKEVSETFRDADFMEIDQTPDGKIVVLYSYNLEYGKDKLGLLVVDRTADDFYYAQIGYEGNWDRNKKEGGVAKDFEMVALDNKYCMVGFNPNKYGENAHLNAYLVVDITKVIRAGEANIVNAVVREGSFSKRKNVFRDMQLDRSTNTLYCLLVGDELYPLFGKMDVSNPFSMSFDGKTKNSKNFAGETSKYYNETLGLVRKKGYTHLILGGQSELSTQSDFAFSPNINVFNSSSFSQSTLGGRTITNKIYEKGSDPIRGWEVKEIVPIGKSLGGVMNGNYKDAVAVLVYKEGEERAKLILVDLTYMGL